ncbi:hypothetical protein VNO77_27475 [Canavalia gladiata]|uniref:Peptidase A1 domain-containing protein n=1 Tax=Canavalia gladiata TaxID=3824 RepID=A0AAN9KVD8_CANGL
MRSFVLLFLSLCYLFVDVSSSLNGFSINLIHRDSPMSPLYDSSKTLSELVTNAATRSISRSNRLDSSVEQNGLSPSPSPFETTIVSVPDLGEYLMTFSIGTPAFERFAIFDTGSDLTWVQCSPCKSCYPQDNPLFDPTQSSTYMDVSCDSEPCTQIPQNQRDCGDSRECFYLKQYSEKSMTIGKLGSDSFSFGSIGRGQDVTFPKTIFGCGMYNNFTFEISSKASGIVGLGAGPLSLVSQLGDQIDNKFSYCLVPFTSTSTGKLKFGNQTMVPNGTVSTPLIIKPILPSYYFINLEGITIGQKTVQTGLSDGNMIIDSMPILTHLEQTLYNDFLSSVKEAIDVEAVQDVPSPFEFCLRDIGANMNFPDFVFHFTGGDVVLNRKHLFVNLDNNLSCMAVLPSTGISIFGNWAQVDFQVEYDLGGKKVSFAPTDCSNN